MILFLFVTHNNKKGNWMPWGSDMMYTRTHTRWDEKHRFDLFRASHFNKKWRTIERKNINDMKRTHTHTHLACLSNHEWRVVTDNVFSMYLPILLLCLFNSISYLPYYFYIFLCTYCSSLSFLPSFYVLFQLKCATYILSFAFTHRKM